LNYRAVAAICHSKFPFSKAHPMFKFLLVLQTLVAASLVAVILMQRSEGGGLGVSSSSAGLMTARGAADFLTRATAILGGMFITISILLASIAGVSRESTTVDTSLARPAQQQQAPAAPATAPAGNETAPAVPLAQ
jgi:preprotein translocase subunit SecG